MNTLKIDLDSLSVLAADNPADPALHRAFPELLKAARMLELIRDCTKFCADTAPNRKPYDDELAALAATLDAPAPAPAAPVGAWGGGWGKPKPAAPVPAAKEPTATFPALIQRAISLGISAQKLADTVVSAETVQQWSKGESEPGVEVKRLIVRCIIEKACAGVSA
jgi:hypothetical protein